MASKTEAEGRRQTAQLTRRVLELATAIGVTADIWRVKGITLSYTPGEGWHCKVGEHEMRGCADLAGLVNRVAQMARNAYYPETAAPE